MVAQPVDFAHPEAIPRRNRATGVQARVDAPVKWWCAVWTQPFRAAHRHPRAGGRVTDGGRQVRDLGGW
jgi:hypothetical protein